MKLKERLEGLTYPKKAKLVNQIKNEGYETQFGELLVIELDETRTEMNRALMMCTDTQKMQILVGRLQGLELVKKFFFTTLETKEK
jgi:hypothetical protein